MVTVIPRVLVENMAVVHAASRWGKKKGKTADDVVSEYVDSLGLEPRSREWYRVWHRLLTRVADERKR